MAKDRQQMGTNDSIMSLNEIIRYIRSWNDKLNPSEFIQVREQVIKHRAEIAAASDDNDAQQRLEHITHYLQLIEEALDDSAIFELQHQCDSLNNSAIDTVKRLAWLTTHSLNPQQTTEVVALLSNDCKAIDLIQNWQNALDSQKRHLLGLHYKVGAAAVDAHHLTTGIPSEISASVDHKLSILDELNNHVNPEMLTLCQEIIHELQQWQAHHQEPTFVTNYRTRMKELLARFKPSDETIDEVLNSLNAAAPNQAYGKISALNQQCEDLVQRTAELEAYYHIDPSIAQDESWEACINQLVLLRTSVHELMKSIQVDVLNSAEKHMLLALNNNLDQLSHIMDIETLRGYLQRLNEQAHMHDELLELVTNPWVITQLNNPSHKALREQLATLNQNSVEQTANMLMSHSRQLLKNIPTAELFNLKSEQCPHYLALTTFFNQLSNFVSTDILSYDLPEDRSACISYWINTMQACRQAGDFNTLAAINAAFNSTQLHRLEASWAGIPTSSKTIMTEIQELFAHQDQQKQLREAMEKTPNAVPFIGPYRTMINTSNEKFKSLRDKFNTIIDNIEKLLGKHTFEEQSDLLTTTVQKLSSIEKERKILPHQFSDVYEEFQNIMSTLKAKTNVDNEIKLLIQTCREKIASARLSDFPEAIYRNQPVFKMQQQLPESHATNHQSSEFIEAITAVETGNEMDNKLYSLSKRVEPQDGNEKPSKIFANIKSITTLERVTPKPEPSKLQTLQNRFLRDQIIKTRQQIAETASKDDIEALNQCTLLEVSNRDLGERLQKIDLHFDNKTIKAINGANKQMRYHHRINSQNLQDAIKEMKLKSTTAGQLGGKSTKKRIDELTSLAKKGVLDRKTLEYKLSKLVQGANLSAQQYQSILADYQDIAKSQPSHGSFLSKLGHSVWDYVKAHPFRALGVAAAGAVACQFAPFIPLFGAKAYAVGASSSLGALFGGESVKSHHKAKNRQHNPHGFFNATPTQTDQNEELESSAKLLSGIK